MPSLKELYKTKVSKPLPEERQRFLPPQPKAQAPGRPRWSLGVELSAAKKYLQVSEAEASFYTKMADARESREYFGVTSGDVISLIEQRNRYQSFLENPQANLSVVGRTVLDSLSSVCLEAFRHKGEAEQAEGVMTLSPTASSEKIEEYIKTGESLFAQVEPNGQGKEEDSGGVKSMDLFSEGSPALFSWKGVLKKTSGESHDVKFYDALRTCLLEAGDNEEFFHQFICKLVAFLVLVKKTSGVVQQVDGTVEEGKKARETLEGAVGTRSWAAVSIVIDDCLKEAVTALLKCMLGSDVRIGSSRAPSRKQAFQQANRELGLIVYAATHLEVLPNAERESFKEDLRKTADSPLVCLTEDLEVSPNAQREFLKEEDLRFKKDLHEIVGKLLAQLTEDLEFDPNVERESFKEELCNMADQLKENWRRRKGEIDMLLTGSLEAGSLPSFGEDAARLLEPLRDGEYSVREIAELLFFLNETGEAVRKELSRFFDKEQCEKIEPYFNGINKKKNKRTKKASKQPLSEAERCWREALVGAYINREKTGWSPPEVLRVIARYGCIKSRDKNSDPKEPPSILARANTPVLTGLSHHRKFFWSMMKGVFIRWGKFAGTAEDIHEFFLALVKIASQQPSFPFREDSQGNLSRPARWLEEFFEEDFLLDDSQIKVHKWGEKKEVRRLHTALEYFFRGSEEKILFFAGQMGIGRVLFLSDPSLDGESEKIFAGHFANNNIDFNYIMLIREDHFSELLEKEMQKDEFRQFIDHHSDEKISKKDDRIIDCLRTVKQGLQSGWPANLLGVDFDMHQMQKGDGEGLSIAWMENNGELFRSKQGGIMKGLHSSDKGIKGSEGHRLKDARVLSECGGDDGSQNSCRPGLQSGVDFSTAPSDSVANAVLVKSHEVDQAQSSPEAVLVGLSDLASSSESADLIINNASRTDDLKRVDRPRLGSSEVECAWFDYEITKEEGDGASQNSSPGDSRLENVSLEGSEPVQDLVVVDSTDNNEEIKNAGESEGSVGALRSVASGSKESPIMPEDGSSVGIRKSILTKDVAPKDSTAVLLSDVAASGSPPTLYSAPVDQVEMAEDALKAFKKLPLWRKILLSLITFFKNLFSEEGIVGTRPGLPGAIRETEVLLSEMLRPLHALWQPKLISRFPEDFAEPKKLNEGVKISIQWPDFLERTPRPLRWILKFFYKERIKISREATLEDDVYFTRLECLLKQSSDWLLLKQEGNEFNIYSAAPIFFVREGHVGDLKERDMKKIREKMRKTWKRNKKLFLCHKDKVRIISEMAPRIFSGTIRV